MPKKHTDTEDEKKLLQKTEDHEYAIVTKQLGGGRFTVKLNITNKEIIGRIVGKLRHGTNKKNNKVEIGCVVLVAKRDYTSNIADIVYVYSRDEVRRLKKSGEIVFTDENDNLELTDETENVDNKEFNFDDI